MEVPSYPAQIGAMQPSSLIAGILVAGTAAHASASKPADVTVYMYGVDIPPSAVDFRARTTVTWMFARTGVRLEWRGGEPKAGTPSAGPVTIQIRFAREAPADASPRVLAYALPFGHEGATITVMYGRIRTAAAHSNLEPPILAHVLAHEIGHVLQGTNRHSETGIMKTQWNDYDYAAMEKKPLEFTPYDVTLIQNGLNARKARNATAAPGYAER
jgi:hypothetical protein